jgi:L-asparagine transporter-like permease
MIAIVAMVGMAGSVVATLYASAGLTRMLAEVGQFPPFFGPGSRLGAKSGVLISAAVVLVVANTVNLSAIASVGSACSLMIFVLVGIAGYRLRGDTGAQAWLILVGVAVTLVVLGFFAVDTFKNAPQTFTAMALVAALAIVLDVVWKRVRARREETHVAAAADG